MHPKIYPGAKIDFGCQNGVFWSPCGSILGPFLTLKIDFSHKNPVLVPKVLSGRGSEKEHGKSKENGEKNERCWDA